MKGTVNYCITMPIIELLVCTFTCCTIVIEEEVICQMKRTLLLICTYFVRNTYYTTYLTAKCSEVEPRGSL